MPGFTTHYLFGQQTYQKLSPSKTKQLIQKYNHAFALGLQGPDLFFYDPGCLLHQKPQIGSMIHESKTADFLCALAQAVLLLKPAGLQKPARAYVLGFMGHYLLDAACHPYVYARTGYQHLAGNDSSAYLGRHIALETDIDTTLLDHFLHRCPGEFRQYDAIDLSDQEISLIAQVLFLALQKVFPQVCPSRKNLEHSIRSMIREIKMLYDPTGLKKALETATDNASAVTITAEVLLTYATADKFPVRNTSDNDDVSGISTVLTSRIANSTTQLPIATGNNKKTTEDMNRYYTADQTKAMLTYTTVDGDGVGDATQQLGINPSDEANPADLIYTRADYDYTNVDAEALAKADKISYKLELFCKQADGSYNENMPLPIGDYLQNSIVKDDGEALSAGNTSCQWKEAFVPVDTKHQFIRLRFSPLTGEEFEKRGYTYSNYRVRLTVVLLDKDGTEISGTQSSDYIIYTNARIYQELLD